MPGRATFLPAAMLVAAGTGWVAGEAPDRAAVREVMAWRANQDREMRGEKSPFAVEAVHVLRREQNTIGSAPGSDVPLRGPGVPALAARAVVRGRDCVLQPLDPRVQINGRPALEKIIEPADRIAIGPYRLQLRRPAGKPALRVSNLRSPALRAYKGLVYFPVNLACRVPATFRPSPAGSRLTVDATAGGPQELVLAGKLAFKLVGQQHTLDAFVDSDEPDELFVIFKDQTSGKETYAVGRYVYAPRPKQGSDRTILDFNKAFNPLCAYGPLFFCPIPPKQNHLPIAIRAGEKPYPGAGTGTSGIDRPPRGRS